MDITSRTKAIDLRAAVISAPMRANPPGVTELAPPTGAWTRLARC